MDFQKLFAETKTIAVVGCSTNPARTSHEIAQYLQQVGYRMIPVNPNYTEVLGEVCYPDLAAIPEAVTVDVVNIFRRSVFTEDAVQSAVQRQQMTGRTPLVWTQLGVSSPEAKQLAQTAGMPYVENRCIYVEHRRWAGGV